jgi:hypothetical protein
VFISCPQWAPQENQQIYQEPLDKMGQQEKHFNELQRAAQIFETRQLSNQNRFSKDDAARNFRNERDETRSLSSGRARKYVLDDTDLEATVAFKWAKLAARASLILYSIRRIVAQERRKADCYRLPLVALIGGPSLPEELEFLHATVSNVSTRGVYFTIDQRLPIGMKFYFSFALPTEVASESEIAIDTKAREVRVDDSPRDGDTGVGIAALFERFKINPIAVGFSLHKAEQRRAKGTKWRATR